jgi:hypothetical protein
MANKYVLPAWLLLFLLSSPDLWAQTLPNLTPYQPSGWSDKIVVSKVTGSTTDSSPLYPTDPLYVDWAVINNGGAATAVRFYTNLYVDGTLVAQWYIDPPLNPGSSAYIQDYSIGTLSAGTHTIEIVADSTNVIAESNENDNAYTKTITITPSSTLPNLTPYQPSGWSDKIVVSKVTGSTIDSSPLYPTDTLYVVWAVINNGSAATGVRFYTNLYVDGGYVTQWYIDPPLNPGSSAYIQDYFIGTLSAGTHTIEIVADSTDVIAESNENDNAYTKTITVTPLSTTPLPGSGGFTETSLGQGSLVTAYGQITTTTTTQPGALANFGYTQNGILTTEAGVAASAPATAARVFVDYSTANGTDSGVAVVNPSSSAITLYVQLNNAQASVTPCPNQTLPANGHLAKFAHELCPNIPNPFLGTLTLTSSTAFAATNLMSGTNAHGEPLYNSLPVAIPNSPPAGTQMYFSQFADGGGFSTEILLMNLTSTSISGTVSFTDDNGSAVTLNFGPSIGSTSTLSYYIPGNGMQKFTTTGWTPGTRSQAGAVVVTSAAGPLPSAAVVFSCYNGTGGLASQAGVLNSPLTIDSRMYVEKASSPLSRRTGVAIVNPNSSDAAVTLTLSSLDGSFTASNTITVQANHHLAAFIDESALMGASAALIPANFQGVLTLSSTLPIAPVTLRLTTNQRGEDLYSTLPVVDLNNPPAGPLYLPQIADGGGYATQIILVNTGTVSGTVTISFFNDAGSQVQIPFSYYEVAQKIAAGYDHSLALRSDGSVPVTVWAWGDNYEGQLGNGTTTGSSVPIEVQGLTNAIAIAAGATHSLAVKSDGTVWAWGDNGDGQLGNGTTTNSTVPVEVQGLTNAIAIAGGTDFSLALKNDGTVWAWGSVSHSELSNGTTTGSSVPVQVQGLKTAIAIAAGHSYSLALRSDGTVWAWGDNYEGELGNGTTTGSSVPVQVQGF